MVTGGHYDVDVMIMDPRKNVIYKEVKKQYDSHTWTASVTGEYRVCFSNEFSTFSHKLVYVDFQVGDEEPLPGVGEHLTAMTQVFICFLPLKANYSKDQTEKLNLLLQNTFEAITSLKVASAKYIFPSGFFYKQFYIP